MQTQPISLNRGGARRKPRYQTYGPGLNEILKDVCEIYDKKLYHVLYGGKKEEFIRCKRIYYYSATKITDANLNSIGKELNTDHATVIYHLGVMKNLVKTKDEEFGKDLEKYTTMSKIWNEYGKRTSNIKN